MQESADLPVWKYDYRFGNNGAAFGAWTEGVSTTAEAFTYDSGSLLQISTFPFLDLADYGVSFIYQFKVYRDDNVLVGDAKFLTFDFHYLSDAPLGSGREYCK